MKNIMRKIVKQYLAVLCMTAVMIFTTGCGAPAGPAGGSGQNAKTAADGELSPLTVTFIDVGQGDSALLECGGHNMLIDAGKNDRGTELQKYLMSRGIKEFDYLVGTHPDEDHIGGLDVIITKFPSRHVLMPEKKADTKTYDDVIRALNYRSMKAEHPKQGETFQLGDASITVVSDSEKKYSDSNNSSIVLMVQHGDNRFLFTGDAEEEAEADMLKSGIDLKADVLKTGHHGSRSSSSQEFLDEVKPKSAVISCEEGNSYGHPHAETLNKFRAMGISVYRTDEEGAIVAESDGSSITFNVPPSDSWQAGEPTGSSASSGGKQYGKNSGQSGKEKSMDYVLNTNTKKFHKPSCNGVDQIKKENREDRKAKRSELISEGYEPCGRCKS